MVQPAPGWFPDPWGAAPLRWWDGWQWTGHVSTPVAAGPGYHAGAYAPNAAAELARHRGVETRQRSWAQLSVAAWAVLTVIQLLTTASAIRSIHSQIRAAQNAIADGAPVTFHTPISPATSLLGLVGLAVAVAFLRWQHSAASVARGLGYPSRVSPGLGVGGWFIPIGSFWLPYQALVDCLPPAHPARPRCLYSWLSFMGYQVMAFTAALVGVFGGPIYPFVVLAAVALAAAVGLGCSCIRAIEADHARAVGTASPGW